MARTALLALLAMMASAAVITSPSGAEDTATQPFTGGAEDVAMVLGSDGNPILAFYDSSTEGLSVVACTDPACVQPVVKQVVDAAPPDTVRQGRGFHPSMVLDASGLPVIAYGGFGGLRIIRCLDVRCTGTSGPGIVASDASMPSLRLDSADRPVVSYWSQGELDLGLIRCVDPACSSHSTEIVYADGNLGNHSSLALGPGDLPIIAFPNQFHSAYVRIAYCGSVSCDGGATIVTPQHEATSGRPSLQLDSAGNPVIAFTGSHSRSAHLIVCADPGCTSVDAAIDLVPHSPLHTAHSVSLQLDSADQPVVSFVGGSENELALLRCRDPLCDSFSINSGLAGPPDLRIDTALALDERGYPVLASPAYSIDDPLSTGISVVRCDDPECDPSIEGDPLPGDQNRDGAVRIAILGDSYISGEGVFSYRPGTEIESESIDETTMRTGNECHQSEASWAYQVALRLTASPSDIGFFACSGARAFNVFNQPQFVGEGSSQLDRLRAFNEVGEVDLIFLSLGGNDAEFSDLVKVCLVVDCLGLAASAIDFGSSDFVEILDRQGMPMIETAVREIREAVPDAAVFHIGYPDLLEVDVSENCPSLGVPSGVEDAVEALVPGWLDSALFWATDGLRIDYEEREWLSGAFLPILNSKLATMAERQGTIFVNPHEWVDGHELCTSEPYFNGLTLGTDIAGVFAIESFHPNLGAHNAIADRFVDEYVTTGPIPLRDTGPAPELAPSLRTSLNAIDQVVSWGEDGKIYIADGEPNGTVQLELHSVPRVIATLQLDSTGSYNGSFVIPFGVQPGLHQLVLRYEGDPAIAGYSWVVLDGDQTCNAKATALADDDGDGVADSCDPDPEDGPQGDVDGDGVQNAVDNCLLYPNASQVDANQNGTGDACEELPASAISLEPAPGLVPDIDGDGHPNDEDNCPAVANPFQLDADGDGIGDACGLPEPQYSFVSIAPIRVLDSRVGFDPLGEVGLNAAISSWNGGGTQEVQLAGVGGVPTSAVAVAVHITSVGPSANAFLEAWPGGAPTAIKNFGPTQLGPFGHTGLTNDLLVLPVDENGMVPLFNSAGDVDLVVDVVGYFTEGAGHGLSSQAPRRILDSRPGLEPVDETGPNASLSTWGSTETKSVQIVGIGGVPLTASAVLAHVTSVGPTANSYLTVWPNGPLPDEPTAAKNYGPTELGPLGHAAFTNDMLVLPVGPDGTVQFYNAAGTVDYVIDVVGWFEDGGASYSSVDLTRILDSRVGEEPPGEVGINAAVTTWTAGQAQEIRIADDAVVPVGAQAVLLHITSVGPSANSFLTVWPDGPLPETLTAAKNYGPTELGQFGHAALTNDLLIASIGPDGNIHLYNNAGTVDLVIDVVGYFS